MNKRGLSPVIATVLLVALALVLALIIFLWARSFIEELIEKDGSNIANSCESVQIAVEAIGSKVYIENTGTVPVFGVEILQKKIIGGEIKEISPFEGDGISAGESTDVGLPSGLGDDATIIVVPILLGENEDGDPKAHVCDEAYGVETDVQ